MSDRMPDVSEERLALLDKALPPYGAGGVVLDVLTESEPHLFALPINTPIERYTVLGVFNLGSDPIDIKVDLADLHLPNSSCEIFEFWEQEYMGSVENTLLVNTLHPHSCRLFAVRPKCDHPKLIGTSIHFTQGAVELRDVTWNATDNELRLIVDRDCRNTESLVFSYGPHWRPLECIVDNRAVQYERVAEGVMRVRRQFKRDQVVQLRFARN